MIKNNKILPTYEQATKIVELSNGVFTESKHLVDGFNVSIFNYRLATYENFVNPIGDESLDGFELRGLTFIFRKNGSLFKRYLLMEKFFNINENEGTQLSDLKKLNIKSVYEKEDGSIITFVKLPNREVLAKSKSSFESYQAIKANKIYEINDNIKSFVDESLNNDIVPIFEYVSPFNKVVLEYEKDELILLRLRDNKTGDYLDIDDVTKKYNIKVPKKLNYSLDEMESLSKTIENKEGWVIDFENGLKVKKKTDWYFSLHRIYTEDINKENFLIDKIINEEIDDVISLLDKSDYHNFIRDKVNKITSIISNYVNDKSEMVMELYEISKPYNDLKYFAKKYVKTDEFSYVMNLHKFNKLSKLNDSEINESYDNLDEYLNHLSSLKLDNQIKNRILKNTYRLENAKVWLLDKNIEIKEYLNK